MHALKIENLEMTDFRAKKILEAMKSFAFEMGYQDDRVNNLECRSRDGFIPFSHNMGGVECYAYMSQITAQCEGTGFKNADTTIDNYHQYDIDSYAKENKISEDAADWTERQLEEFDEWNQDSDGDPLLSLDIMLQGENELNLRFCVCVKDAPYHRQYDDKFEFDIEFKNITELKTKLKILFKNKQVKRFSRCLDSCY